MSTKQTKNNFIILEASAGSGKTHNLAKRYINLLLNFDSSKELPPLNNILALTFANKATIEMKERIIEYLKKISLGKEVKGLLENNSIPNSILSKNAFEAVNRIISNFDHFNVRTIDSFINLIIKACALKLGISPNYEILDSYDDYIDYSIDTFLDKSSQDKQIKDILDSFFNQYIIDNSLSWNIRGSISENFKKLYSSEITKKIVAFNKFVSYSQRINSLCGEYYNICKAMKGNKNITSLDSRIVKYIDKILNKEKDLTDDISAYFLREEPPYKSKAIHDDDLTNLFYKAKNIIKDFMEFRSKHFFDNYIKMFDFILQEFDTRSKLDSVMFLQDINKQVNKVFNKETLAPEIYLSLSNNFTDFLIDEFQDTNKTQWQTLKLIVEENLSKGGSFFYVGDKKQAIYGFRGSDYKIFDLPKKEFANIAPHYELLDTNYRSCQAIIDFNNNIYTKDNVNRLLNYISSISKHKFLNDINDYTIDIVNVFNNSMQKCLPKNNNLGYVDISYKEYDNTKDNIEEIRKQYLYNTVDDLLTRFSKKDITILCRTNDEIEIISRWLLEKGIDIESYQTLNIINSSIIKELFSALQFFNSPINNISFSAFITSSIFLKATGLNKNEMVDFIVNNSLEHNTTLYILFRDKYLQIWNTYIEEFFTSAGFIAVYEMIISLISKYKIIDNFKEYSNVILRFLEVARDFEKDNQGMQNFIDYFKDFENNEKNEKFFIKIPSSNAITVTTVHKSKGLQFNVVVMPFFNIKTMGEHKNVFYEEFDDTVSYLKITQKATAYSKYLENIYYSAYFKQISDELNALYVATTRAIYEFYGLILQKQKKDDDDKNELITYFIEDKYRHFGKKQIYNKIEEDDDKEQNSEIKLVPTQYSDIVEIVNDSSLEIYGKKNQDILLKGKIIHYALANIVDFTIDNMGYIIDEAISNVAVCYPDQEIDWLKPLLLNLLNNKDVAKFFDVKNEIYNEKEFVDSTGNTIRIDKLVITKNSINIVDFKSSIYNDEQIKEQMNKYKNILNKIYTNKNINCYVVDIENNKVIVED